MRMNMLWPTIPPQVATPSKAAQDGETARALWAKTEELLGAALAKTGLA